MARERGSGVTPPHVVELLKHHVSLKSMLEVSRSTGLGLAAIGRYIKGIGEPTTSTLIKLAAYFGVNVEWLRQEEIADADVIIKLLDKYFLFIESLPTREKRAHGIFFSMEWFYNQYYELRILCSLCNDDRKAKLESYLKVCEQLKEEYVDWAKKNGGLLGH